MSVLDTIGIIGEMLSWIGPEEDRTGKKDQLIVSRSFSEKVTTVAGMRQALSIYAQEAATRLVKHSQVARSLTAFAGTRRRHEQKHYPSVRLRLPFPTPEPVERTRAAPQLLPRNQGGTRYARAGLMLTDLLPADTQLSLEPFRASHEDASIATLIDTVSHSICAQRISRLTSSG